MIQINCKEALYTYDMYHITKAFFPQEEIKQHVQIEQEPLITIEFPSGSCFCVACGEVMDIAEKRGRKQHVNQALYRFLCTEYGHKMAWGILTGIRPTKIVMKKLEE